jgi:hypothetical protein
MNMKRILIAAAVSSLLAIGAAAQDSTVATYTFRADTVTGSVMGTTIKGAPYSADEITESLQVLGDGTRISHQNQVTVYRDGEGRVRRESPNQITISDPVAKVSYTLNPKNMTATKSTVSQPLVYFMPRQSTAADVDLAVAKQQVDMAETMASLDKLKAELQFSQNGGTPGVVVNGSLAPDQVKVAVKEQLDVAMEKLSQAAIAKNAKVESLGQQVMQGVAADGTRTTTTIEAGAIGNDRPIQVVSERWYSAELQTAVMTKRTDPRTGEETFRLDNVHRGEPGAGLFLVPPGYQMVVNATRTISVKKEE